MKEDVSIWHVFKLKLTRSLKDGCFHYFLVISSEQGVCLWCVHVSPRAVARETETQRHRHRHRGRERHRVRKQTATSSLAPRGCRKMEGFFFFCRKKHGTNELRTKAKSRLFLGQDIFFWGEGNGKFLFVFFNHADCLFSLLRMKTAHVTDYLTGT